ncbi:MAG: hypothetical protein HQK78_18540 [Desulfobacterales bacterium]|nr:hypothetical protein [Desulfobacterales bacterium]
MKVKNVRIGIKDVKTALDDFVKTAEAIERGEEVKKKRGIYFTNIAAFKKALTEKRMELLHIIKTQKPSSINELSRMAGRNTKNVSDDLKYLEQIGLVDTKSEKKAKEIKPLVKYDKILLEINL